MSPALSSSGFWSAAVPLLGEHRARGLLAGVPRADVERDDRLGEVVVRDRGVAVDERQLEPEWRLLEDLVVLALALDLVVARALERRLERRHAPELALDLGVGPVREGLDRRGVPLGRVRQVGQRRRDVHLERALAGADRLDDLHAVVCVREAARLGLLRRLELPVEPVVLDLVVRRLRGPCPTEQGAQVPPPLVVGRRRHVGGGAVGVPRVGQAQVREPGAARREVRLEAVAVDRAHLAGRRRRRRRAYRARRRARPARSPARRRTPRR